MKSILAALLIIASLSATAQADIICQSAAPNQFGVKIKTGLHTKTSFYETTAPAEVTLHGLRLYYKVSTKMVSSPIKTRLGVGTGYQFDLGANYAIHLEDITYAPTGYESLLGFTGYYVNGRTNTSIPLKCK